MKLIVQIPCFNEEHTLPETVADIPRQIDGIDKVEFQVMLGGKHDSRNAFVQVQAGAGGTDLALESKLNLSLADLKLSVRASNCLESENIHTVRDLVQRNEDQLLEVRNFGDTTLDEVKQKLTELGLHLGMRVPTPAAVPYVGNE